MKETVRTRLIEERKRRQWSQQEVADRLGTTRNNVSRWEQGSTTPGPYFRTKIGELFGKSIEELGLLPENEPLPNSVGMPIDASLETISDLQARLAEQPGTTVLIIPNQGRDTQLSRISGAPVFVNPALAAPAYSQARFRRSQLLLLLFGFIALLGISLGGIFVGNGLLKRNTKPPLTAQQSISATVAAAVRDNTNPYGPAQAQLVFDDALQQNIPAHYWEVDPLASVAQFGQHHCLFQEQSYELVANGPNICNEYMSSFTNMVYQVELSQLRGVSAGIDFRATDDNNFYYFHLNLNGGYQLDLVTVQGVQVLAVGSCTCAITGLRQWNLLAVKVVGSTIDLYINIHHVDRIVDTTHPKGLVGVGGGAHADTAINDVLFRNARVWQL